MNKTNKTIIIAEDEDDIREVYLMALSSAGYDVLQAKNGKEVFEWLEKKDGEIDLIVLDIVMPEMDGFEVLEKIEESGKYTFIPIIMSTNLDNSEDKKNALGHGAKEYFVKSNHTPSELATHIAKILSEDDKKTV